jgi:hypothetical protein
MMDQRDTWTTIEQGSSNGVGREAGTCTCTATVEDLRATSGSSLSHERIRLQRLTHGKRPGVVAARTEKECKERACSVATGLLRMSHGMFWRQCA